MLVGSASSQDSIGNIPPSDYTPPGSISSRNSIPRADSDEFPAPPPDSMAFHRHSSGSFAPVTPPPDLTRQAFSSTDSIVVVIIVGLRFSIHVATASL